MAEERKIMTASQVSIKKANKKPENYAEKNLSLEISNYQRKLML
jgi:hypothetical protein